MSDLGLLSYYLGIEVRQSDGVITIAMPPMLKRFWNSLGWKTATHVTYQWKEDCD